MRGESFVNMKESTIKPLRDLLPVFITCIYYLYLLPVFFSKYYSGDQIVNNEMGRACGTYGRRRGTCRVLAGVT